jgi:NAD(P)-dependent dehydrogenase (short-subunit alcohol dehydrogenase family)
MEIDLQGQVAIVVGDRGALLDAVCVALEAKGAHVAPPPPPNRLTPREAVAQVLDEHGRLDALVMIPLALRETRAASPPNPASVAWGESIAEAAAYVDSAADALGKNAGRIVIVGSALGLVPARYDLHMGHQHAALFQLMRGLAMQLAPRVRINALALGAVGDETAPLAGDARLLSHVPSHRSGTMQEITDAMLFLLDPENTYMTGHVLPVDGGWAAGFARDF